MKKFSVLIIILLGSIPAFAQDLFSSYERAKLHPLTYDRPAPDFFEGALLGNGAMGVVVTTRPDAVVFYFGHNNVWDIRIAENNKEKIGTFKEVFNRVKAIPDTLKMLTDDPWYREYSGMAAENYRETLSPAFPLRFGFAGFRPAECGVTWSQTGYFKWFVRSLFAHKR